MLLGALYTCTLMVAVFPLWETAVIVALPAFTPLIRPSALTATYFLLLVLKL